jgi:hypothetical protein
MIYSKLKTWARRAPATDPHAYALAPDGLIRPEPGSLEEIYPLDTSAALEEFLAVKSESDALDFVRARGFLFAANHREERAATVASLAADLREFLSFAGEARAACLREANQGGRAEAIEARDRELMRLCAKLFSFWWPALVPEPRLTATKGMITVARPQNLASQLVLEAQQRGCGQAFCGLCGASFLRKATGRPRAFCDRCTHRRKPGRLPKNANKLKNMS